MRVKNLFQAGLHRPMCLLKVFEKVLKETFLEATGRTCGCTRVSAKHREMWWWNGDAKKSASEKPKLRE